jgi:hypothetical protein
MPAAGEEPEQPPAQLKIWVKVVEAHAVRTWVAIILTTFAGLSLLILTAGAVWNTIANPEITDLSANFMTVISGALGVIFGALSGFLGNQALTDKGGAGPLSDDQITLEVDDQTKPEDKEP